MSYIIAGSADPENLKKTILTSISLEEIADYCPSIIKVLQSLYNKDNIYLWALSSSDIYKKFNYITAGDILLLREKRSKYFNFSANIVYKTESCKNIGKYLWNDSKWTRLLFLKDIQNINIEYQVVSRALEVDEEYNYSATLIKDINELKEYNNDLMYILNNIIINNSSFEEGKKTKTYTNQYERNKFLRDMVVKYKGCTCKCCGFNFKDIYGEIGNNYIHIHHITPLSNLEKETLNTINSLEPICPNCHAMIHRNKDKTYTIKEIQEFISKNKN